MVESPVPIRGKYCLDRLGDASAHERVHSQVWELRAEDKLECRVCLCSLCANQSEGEFAYVQTLQKEVRNSWASVSSKCIFLKI